MFYMLFAADLGGNSSGITALGISWQDFVIQLITFVLIFFLLKRFAFKPIVKILEDRRKTIDDGVLLGRKLEKQREEMDEEVAKVMREARLEADRIIANGHKEAREVMREADKAAQRKAEALMADAELRIQEDTEQAKRGLEKEIVALVSEATEAIVGEKVDPKKDAEIIDKVMKGRLKK